MKLIEMIKEFIFNRSLLEKGMSTKTVSIPIQKT